MPRIADNLYGSNVLFFRWNRMNKMQIRGGTQIEFPVMYQHMAAGGAYQGYQILNVAPSDTIQNGVVAWKQYYVPVTVDGLTLLRADSPLAVVDYVATQFKQAEMELSDMLGAGLLSNGSNALFIDGVYEVLSTSGTYGGISQATNTWWQAQVDALTSTLTAQKAEALYQNCTSGGRSPTLIVTDASEYANFWGLQISQQQFPVQPGGKDQQMAQAGWENILFNGTPVVQDSHMPLHGLNMLNEDYFDLVVSERANFKLQDFQTPVNQDAMTALLFWAGNLVCQNPGRQGAMTGLTS
jgi:hypothetical protein